MKAISDKICVIRDGEHIAISQRMSDDIITMMVGREITSLYPHEPHNIGEEVLRVENSNRLAPNQYTYRPVDNANFGGTTPR